MDLLLKSLIAALLAFAWATRADVVPVYYDTTTKKIVAPTNLLGFTMASQNLTNLVGPGLTNDAGTLKAVATGSNTGDVTLAGTPDYLTIAGQVLTRGLIDLVTDVTGVLPHGNLGTGGGGATKFLREDSTFQTIPGGGDALTASPLSQFAATTSLQLAGVLSDETGTGLFVLSASPSFTGTLTNAGSIGAPTMFLGATNLAVEVANKQPLDPDLTTLATLNAAALTNLNGSEIRSGTVAAARIDPALATDAEVSSATSEATLEAILDLQDLQGAVTDAQVPNNITVDLATTATTANAGDSATAFFTSGEIEDARLPAGLARDSEVSATYAPLASPALTGSPTVPTASTATSNTVVASTAYVDRAVALGGGGGGGSSAVGSFTLWNPNFSLGPMEGYIAARDSAAYANFGDSVSGAGTASAIAVSSNAPMGVRYRGTAANTTTGVNQAGSFTWSSWLSTNAFLFSVGGGGSTSNRWHCGWYLSSPVLSDAPANGYGLRYSGPGGAGDTNWRFISNDGVSTNNVDTGVAYSENSLMFVTFVRPNQSNVVAYINGVVVGTNAYTQTTNSLIGYVIGRSFAAAVTNDVNFYRQNWRSVIP